MEIIGIIIALFINVGETEAEDYVNQADPEMARDRREHANRIKSKGVTDAEKEGSTNASYLDELMKSPIPGAEKH